MGRDAALHDLEIKLWVEKQELAALPTNASDGLKSAIEAEVERLRQSIAELERQDNRFGAQT